MLDQELDHLIALHRAIEIHCKNEIIPDSILKECPYFGKKLNENLAKNKVSIEFYEFYKNQKIKLAQQEK